MPMKSFQSRRSSYVRKKSIFASWTPNGPRFVHHSMYSPESQKASCVQKFPERLDILLTNNWSVEIMVKRLNRTPKRFSLSTGVPQMLRCDGSITPRQIATWPTTPLPIVTGYPRAKRFARAISSKDSAMLTPPKFRNSEPSISSTRSKACR